MTLRADFLSCCIHGMQQSIAFLLAHQPIMSEKNVQKNLCQNHKNLRIDSLLADLNS